MRISDWSSDVCSSDLFRSPPWPDRRLRAPGKGIAWQRWNDHVMAAGDKRPDQLLELKKRTGPAMDQHKRQAGTIAPGMDKLRPLPLNFHGKLSEPEDRKGVV